MVNINSIKVGNIVKFNEKLCVVLKSQHVKPGKGGAFAQMELKDIIGGTKYNERFRSEESLEVIRLDEENYQYLYPEGDNLVFMNNNTYEQINMPKDLIGDNLAFLEDNMVVKVCSYMEKPISVMLPDTLEVEILETEAVVKGQTAASSYKPATVKGGVRISVPPFIAIGDKVVIRTSDMAYLERVK